MNLSAAARELAARGGKAPGDLPDRCELAQGRLHHWLVLALAVFVIAAAFCLRWGEGGRLRLPGTRAALPTTCASRLMFGVECPGCGLTRSFVALAAGDVAESYRYNRVGWIVALAVVAQVPYRLIALGRLKRGLAAGQGMAWMGLGLVAALVVNWLLRMVGV